MTLDSLEGGFMEAKSSEPWPRALPGQRGAAHGARCRGGRALLGLAVPP